MGQSYTALDYHIVYSTKDRLELITPEVRPRLYDYIGGIIAQEGGQMREVGGMPDHLHILARLSSTRAIADVLRVVKTNSSKWVRETFSHRRFAWQAGYAAFTVSRSNVDRVRGYIQNQERHHKKLTLKQEVVALLEKHEVEYDKQYLWA